MDTGACGRPQKNRVSAPPSFQGRCFIDSVPFWDRFGDDFEDFPARCSVVFCKINDKYLYTCAVAEPRLAALKIKRISHGMITVGLVLFVLKGVPPLLRRGYDVSLFDVNV